MIRSKSLILESLSFMTICFLLIIDRIVICPYLRDNDLWLMNNPDRCGDNLCLYD